MTEAKTFTSLMRIKPVRNADNLAIPVKALMEPAAPPTLSSVRQPISGHPAEGLTPVRLSAIHRAAAQGEPERYFELAEDIEERDLHYSGVLSTRKRSVAQLPMTVIEASDAPEHVKHAEFLRSWVNEGVLEDSLFDMLDAIGKGISFMEIDWHTRHGHLCPREFVYRPQRWFKFDREDGETPLLRDGGLGVPLQPHKFLVHRHPSKSGLTIRSGLARVASWAWMYKAFTLKDWAIFCQNYGQPIRVGRYGPNATNEDKDVLWRAVSQIAGDCAAIIPDGMKIEFEGVSDKASTSDLYEKRADWMDRQISKAVLGQTTTTDAVSGGHAVAKEHRLVQEDIERSDAKMVSATINMQLIPHLIAFNFGPQDHYPKVRVGRPEEVPLGEFSTAFSLLGPLGLTAPAQFMRERLGIPTPDANDEIVGGRAPAPIQSGQDIQRALAQAKRNIFDLHFRSPPDDDLAALNDQLADTATPQIETMTAAIKEAIDSATSLHDAKRRLDALALDAKGFESAMAQAMKLAHLAGQAALIDDIDAKRNRR